MLKRSIYKVARELLGIFPIISITGPRQAGKTTLLKEEFKDYQYVNLENPLTQEFFNSDPKSFFETYHTKVIFDEAQQVPKLFSYLQVMVDESGKMGEFILSGSQNFLLLQKISQTLAGRVGLLKLMPFDFRELKAANLLPKSYEEIMFNGFYPALYDRDISPNRYYPNYIQTYVERDVTDIINIRDINQFKLFMRLCAARVGQSLNINGLSRECGISQPTAKAWLSVLESSYIIYLLPPYFKNYNKVLTKSPKLYFYDTGLLCNMLGIKSIESLNKHRQRGSIFENMIITELHKQSYHNYTWEQYFYWRDSNGNEVDLIRPNEEQLDIFEIKSSKTILKSHLKGIDKFGDLIGSELKNKYLIYGGNEDVGQRFGTIIQPWNLL
ncbi:hypothetical protein SAMN06298216_1402 [Spirosomataceae bacterium TFI 002]|nr:hypothetical protein SAMN06298216_1402 [Spirosomataceae bacterium TFI 002]